MSENTKIEWCDHTWSPWRGCTKVSPGCANCYAEALSKRNPAVLGNWGKGKPRVLAKNWNDPVKWDASVEHHEKMMQPVWDTAVRDRPFSERLGSWPVKRPRVFPSLCDWLDEEVDTHWLARFLALIHSTPNLDWLLLTKRPEAWRKRIASAYSHMQSTAGDGTPQSMMVLNWLDGKAPKNVWVGTSVEDQTRADERIPDLLKIPAKLRFLSVEPLLGQMNIGWWLAGVACPKCGGATIPRFGVGFDHERRCPVHGSYDPDEKQIDWVIVGGESGPGARPCNVEWVRDIVAQCRSNVVPCFVKQLGANPVQSWDDPSITPSTFSVALKHPKGGDPAEWPEDLRVRQFPEVKL